MWLKRENSATDNTDKHERYCSSSSLLDVFYFVMPNYAWYNSNRGSGWEKEKLATDNTDKHERNCSSSSLLEVFSDCTNLKKDDNRMTVIPVKKNDCHSRENGNLLFYSVK